VRAGSYRCLVNEPWHPLSRREAPDGPQLQTGISRPMEKALRDWILDVINKRRLDEQRLIVRCDLDLDARADDQLDEAEQVAFLARKEKLWDLIDAVLDLAALRKPAQPVAGVGFWLVQAERQKWQLEVRRPLQVILDDAGSIFTVRKDGAALEQRMDPAVAALLEDAAAAADRPDRGSATRHLLQAREAAYARTPDTVKAYGEAIKAVEAAAHATLQPKHAKATLGTMLGEYKQIRGKLTTPIARPTGETGIEAVESLMDILWAGQTSRHGNLEVTRDETPEEAIEAVHIAALLVQLFASGAIRRAA